MNKKVIICLSGFVLGFSVAAANAGTLIDKRGSFSEGTSKLGADGSYHIYDNLQILPKPNYMIYGDASVSASILNDKKNIASYNTQFDLDANEARLKGDLKLGGSTVWTYNSRLVQDIINPAGKHLSQNPFGKFVKPFTWDGDQKWVFGALRADMKVTGSVAYSAEGYYVGKQYNVSAKYAPTVEAAGTLQVNVPTKWPVKILGGIIGGPITRLVIRDAGVQADASPVSPAKVGVDTSASLGLNPLGVCAKAAGSVVQPEVNVRAHGFIKYWLPFKNHTKTFGDMLIFNQSGKTLNKTLIDVCKGAENTYEWSGWFDRDNANGDGDWETLADFTGVCDEPGQIQARVVGTNLIYTQSSKNIPDTLSSFSPLTGLVCKNDVQSDGSCSDYEVRFLCKG